MRTIILFFSILLFGCNQKTEIKKAVIKTNLVKHYISENAPYIGEQVRKNGFYDKIYPEVTGIPDKLNNVKLYQIVINGAQSFYQAYYDKKITYSEYIDNLSNWASDTIACTKSFVNTYISIIQAMDSNDKKCYMIDINNNNDFSDETIDYPTYVNSHKVNFEKNKSGKIISDSTWISFRFSSDSTIGYHFNECRSAKFIIDSEEYRIILYPFMGIVLNYNLWTPKIELYSEDAIREIKKNEPFKLNGKNYIIDSIANDGSSFVIEKVMVDNELGSTQIGNPPLSFKARTLKGDSINFPSDFKGKYVLLDFWFTTCAPCVYEIKNHYIDYYNKWGGENFEIIGVANDTRDELNNFSEKNNINWILIPDGEKKDILKLYNINEYPTLYLIDDTGRIISKGSTLRDGGFKKIINQMNK